MAKPAKRLTVKRLERLREPGRYRDGGERGLYAQVMSPSNRSWLLRYELDGRERWMGLGPLDLVGLADARRRAREARLIILEGIDPIEARHAARDAKRKEEAARVTFKEAAEQFLDLHEQGWKNKKHRKQWRNTLTVYAYPKLGAREVQNVDSALITDVVTPLSKTPETAQRVRLRIERVLEWVKDGKPIPTRLLKRGKKHHAALPWQEIPVFMAELRQREGVSARALEYLVLTAARTSEVIETQDNEFDLDAKMWTIPGERMKAGKPHRVPLPDRAVEIVRTLPREKDNPYVFIGAKEGKPLSNMAMLELLRGMRPGLTVHGFRSAFKDWASEATNHPNLVSEMALAHAIKDKTEAAYRRGDLYLKRTRLSADWAKFCGTPSVAEVHQMKKAG